MSFDNIHSSRGHQLNSDLNADKLDSYVLSLRQQLRSDDGDDNDYCKLVAMALMSHSTKFVVRLEVNLSSCCNKLDLLAYDG